MFDINLVPEIQKQRQEMAKRNTYATVFAIGLVGAVVLGIVILGSLKVAANISLSNTKEKIEEVNNESAQYKDLETAVLSLENGLKGISETLDGQNTWTRLLPHLEAATPSDVQFTSLGLEGNTLTAQLKGRSVNSIAKLIESYKNYQVFVVSGSGTPQNQVQISLDGTPVGTATIKSDGTWVYAIKATTSESHTIEATENGSTARTVYNPETKQFESGSGSISVQIENLFSNINTKQFSKEAGVVSFDATLNILTEALW